MSSCTFCPYSTHNCIAQERNSVQSRTQGSQPSLFYRKAEKFWQRNWCNGISSLFFGGFPNKLYKPLRLVGIKSNLTRQIVRYEILPKEWGDWIWGRTSVIFTVLMIGVIQTTLRCLWSQTLMQMLTFTKRCPTLIGLQGIAAWRRRLWFSSLQWRTGSGQGGPKKMRKCWMRRFWFYDLFWWNFFFVSAIKNIVWHMSSYVCNIQIHTSQHNPSIFILTM